MCKICTVIPARSYCVPVATFPPTNKCLNAGESQVMTSYYIPGGNIVYSDTSANE